MLFTNKPAGNLFKKLQRKLVQFIDSNRKESGWVSWDPHPWRHPWLTSENLRRMRQFSKEFLEHEKRALNYTDPTKLNAGFCGNMANSLYMRARPLCRVGINSHIFLHPFEEDIMGHPAWEEIDLTLDVEQLSLDELSIRGYSKQSIADIHQFDVVADWKSSYDLCKGNWLRESDTSDYGEYLSYMKTLIALQEMDVTWGASHGVYLSYLANRPYVVSQTGGDIWFEASRNDMLGHLVRKSFASARVFLASNPWSFAHARRYGFRNVVYLPLTLDESLYIDGTGNSRLEWEARGGSFFVLSSSRLDERNKGSSIGIEGFASFSRNCPGARLVLIGWGREVKQTKALIEKLGISDKVIYLPISSKGRIRDYLRSADVFLDQFVLGYYGSAGLEAMACGLPVIGRIEKEQYDAICETGAPPILNSATSEEVAMNLNFLSVEQTQHQLIRQATRKWFLDNQSSQRWLKETMGILVSTAGGLATDFTHSPLQDTLSLAEERYLEEGLKVAPTYPNYGW